MARQVTRSRTTTTWDLVGAAAGARHRLETEVAALPDKPGSGVPALPDDPTDLSDSALMTLMARMTEWTTYMGVRLAAAEVDESSAAELLDRFKALSAVRNNGEKTVTAAKAKAYEDPEFLAAKKNHGDAYAYRKMLSALYDATDRKGLLLSREVTRRVGREPRENRTAKYGA